MQQTIYIRDELVLEAHPEERHILIRRERAGFCACLPERGTLPGRRDVLDGGGDCGLVVGDDGYGDDWSVCEE